VDVRRSLMNRKENRVRLLFIAPIGVNDERGRLKIGPIGHPALLENGIGLGSAVA
jgi:hypothetical protein